MSDDPTSPSATTESPTVTDTQPVTDADIDTLPPATDADPAAPPSATDADADADAPPSAADADADPADTDADPAAPPSATDADPDQEAIAKALSAVAEPATAGEAPAEETPMPSPAECLNKHLGDTLLQAMGARTEEEMRPLRAAHSLEDMAVEVERAQREMAPYLEMLPMMQRFARSRRQASAKQRQELDKMMATEEAKYKQAEEVYLDARDELRGTVRTFLHTLEDHEQQARTLAARERQPFSKGVIRHFWDAVQRDDPVKLLKTLCTEDMVRRADFAVYRSNRCAEVEQCRPLMDLLTTGDHHFVPDGGAVRCVEALKERYPGVFE